MNKTISIFINGNLHQVPNNISVAAAIAISGKITTRISVSGKNRAPLCGMGVCQECRVTINGQAHQLACQTLCVEAMHILTGHSA